jgi:hypothetical protein
MGKKRAKIGKEWRKLKTIDKLKTRRKWPKNKVKKKEQS